MTLLLNERAKETAAGAGYDAYFAAAKQTTLDPGRLTHLIAFDRETYNAAPRISQMVATLH
jgi:hypothetical protein